MSIKIITDTSSDISFEEQKEFDIHMIPFKMIVGGKEFVDDMDLDYGALQSALENSPKKAAKGECILSTSCPAPADFLEAYEEYNDHDIIVLTISNILSGSYNSANLAMDMYKEKYPEKKIAVINTKSDSAGPALVTYRAVEAVREGRGFEEIVADLTDYVETLEVFVILERLDNVIKTGRLSRGKGKIASALNIVPLMVGDHGELIIHSVQRGIKKTMNRFIERVGELCEDTKGKKIVITHTHGEKNYSYIVKQLEEKYDFAEIIVRPTRGISMCYTDIGGMVLSFETK